MAVVPGGGCSSRNDAASGAQVIDSSVRMLNGLNNGLYYEYFKRSPAADGNRRIYTFSVWCLREQLTGMSLGNGYSTGTFDLSGCNDFRIEFESSRADALTLYDATSSFDLTTNAQYRDISAWYHVVVAVDTTQSSSSNRAKVYVNGVQQTSFATSTYPSQNAQGDWNDNSYTHYLSQRGTGSPWAGNLSQYYVIDGQQLAASDFGFTDPLTNTWRPKKFIPPYKPNTGLSWSGMCSGGTDSGYGHEKAFDGADNTNAYPSPGSTVTMTIPAGKLKYTTSFEAWVSRDTNGGNITVNGGGNVTPSGSGFQIVDLSGEVSAGTDITEITWARAGAGSIGIAMIYIMIDGVALLDDDNSNFGGQGFYLPLDGKTFIGKDLSGRGNNWTPVNFGAWDNREGKNASSASATVPIDTPGAGALPILNTVSGGKVASSGFRTDPHASSLVLAIPGGGDIKDYSATIKGSGTNKTVTNNGATTPTTKSHYYGSAIYSDGSDSEFQVGSSTEADFAFDGEFTWEMWWYPISSGATTHARAWYFGTAEDDGGGAMHWYTSGNVNLLGGGASGATSPLGSTDFCTGTVTMDAWNHIAITRDGANLVRAFLNGAAAGTATVSNEVSSGERTFYVGGPSYETAQYWQDIRLYNGVCKYSEEFNPGSPFPDVQMESPSGVSYGAELTKPSSPSVYFDGTGDYLQIADSADFDMGTGDFTLECFVYSIDDSDYQGVFGSADYDDDAVLFQISDTGLLRFTQPSGTINVTGTTDLQLGGWHHIVMCRSGTTLKGFVDGREEISETYSSSIDWGHSSNAIVIGAVDTTDYPGQYQYKGYISNLRLVKGTALYTSNFTPPTTPLTNVTNTKLLCCNESTPIGSTVTPAAITANGDVASNTFNPFDGNTAYSMGRAGKYATWNALWMGTSDVAMNTGNLQWFTTSNGPDHCTYSTVGMTSGKFYWENEIVEATATGIGIANNLANPDGGPALAHNWIYYSATGQTYMDGSAATYGDAFNTNGIMMGVAFDRDNLTLEFFREGVSQGKLTGISGLTDTETYYAMCGDSGGASQSKVIANFGQKPFRYAPPDGFGPLVWADQTTPPVVRSDQYMDIQAYEGNGVSPRTIDGFNFAPDLIWYKETSVARDWQSYDTVRGAGTNKNLTFNTIYAENANDDEQYGYTSAFNVNGWVLTDGSAGSGNGDIYTNDSGQDYMAYAWKAGGNKNTFNIDDVGYSSAAAAGLDGGDINPSGASINTKAGFSILKYAGNGSNAQAINHGLGAIPDFVICKNLGTSYNWFIWHQAFGNNANAAMYFTDAVKTTGFGTQPFGTFTTSSLVFNGVNDGVCGNYDYICWAWKNVPGVQKFGSYTGNNNANGPFVELGFRPSVLMIKRETGASANWYIMDKDSQSVNPVVEALEPNTSDTTNTASVVAYDFLSNGFKVRGTDGDINASSTPYIYCAWADAPSGGLYGGQSNAR